MAGWVAAIGSALLVVTLFDSMSQLRSVEMREAIEEFLATYPGNGLGLEPPQVVEILRGATMVAAAAAAAAAVLAVYVLQRNRGARIGFTVAAVALMFTAPVTGSPLALVVAAAAMMLWTRPARDWFAGRPAAPRPPARDGTLASSEDRPPRQEPAGGDSGSAEWPRMPEPSSDRPVPPPTQGFGSSAGHSPAGGVPQQGQGASGEHQPSQYPAAPAWPAQGYGQQPPPPYGGYDAGKRPATVTVAAWLTWVLSGLTLVVFGFVVLALLAAKDQLVDAIRTEPELQRLDLPLDDVIALLWVTTAVCVFWCLAAMALAFLAYRRQNWARIALVVSAAVTVLFGVATIPFGLLNLLAAAATIVLLFTGGANDWFSRRGGGYPPYSQGRPGGYPGQPGGYPGQPGPQPDGPAQPESGDKKDPPTNVW
jgi:hypothetical protein